MASKMENLIKAIYGDDVNAAEIAEKMQEKRREEMHRSFEQAKNIMRSSDSDMEDIPGALFVRVAANALIKQVEPFERDYNFFKRVNKEDFIIEELKENASTLIAANVAYGEVCREFNAGSVLSEVETQRLMVVVKEATALCRKYAKNVTVHDMQVFAFAMPYYETMEFAKKKVHTVNDAMRVVAAHSLCQMIINAYRPYNVKKAEQRILDMEKFIHYKKYKDQIPAAVYKATLPAGAKDNMEILEGAAEEIKNLLENTEEAYGYKLNYIKSGKQVYSVWKWKGEVEEIEGEVKPGILWAEDKGEYDTPEEAHDAADEDDEIEAYDPEEMWAIVDKEGKNPTNMIYPTRERAAVFLIGILGEERLPFWFAWEKCLNNMEAHEKGGENA